MKTVSNVLILFIVFFSSACSKLNNEHDEARNLPLAEIDFSKLSSGKYRGYYAGGMCGWRENECKVTVDSITGDSSRVTEIELVWSAEDPTQSFLQELYNRVIEKQSLQVDVISGATLTSKAHLKAIEDALLKSEIGSVQ